MNAAYYSGHDLEWTQKFMNAIPKNKGLDPAKAVCIAITLQHKYTLTKNREITLNHNDLKIFGLQVKNLKKYLPYFEKKKLIKWVRKKGAAPKIILNSLPPNYVMNNHKKIKEKNKIKETSDTVSQVTSDTVSQVISDTVSEVENTASGRQSRKQEKKSRQRTKTKNLYQRHKSEPQIRDLNKQPRLEEVFNGF